MKGRPILVSLAVSLAVCLAFVAAAIATDGNMGTWKLNEAKSKVGMGAAKNHTVVYAAAGDSVKITVDGMASDGKPVHHEWTGKYDGKDYAVTGDAGSDTRSYTRVDDRTLDFNAKKAGKVTMTGRVILSADGKTRTVTTSATDAKGKIDSTGVYDRQ